VSVADIGETYRGILAGAGGGNCPVRIAKLSDKAGDGIEVLKAVIS